MTRGGFQVPLKWWMRRYNPAHLYYRVRLPARRRRWLTANFAATAAYPKNPEVRPAEPALIVGDFRGQYGLSRGANYDQRRIHDLHEEAYVVDVGDFLYGSGAPPRIEDLPKSFGTAYLLCQPDIYPRILTLFQSGQLERAYRIGRWVWETPLFPRAWAFAPPLVHEIWTPSEFSAQALRRSGLPVRVFEHPVSPPPFVPNGRSRFGIDPAAFLGLAVMDIQSCPERKNPWAHVRAWREAFAGDPHAVLILKIRTGKRTRLVAQELRELIRGHSNIRLIEADLSDADIASLQHACDVYLSLHRSEGYGLNLAECLAIGKPVLATHWSANTEYGPGFPSYYGIPYKLVRYRDWMRHFAEADFVWAEADVVAAADRLRLLRAETAAQSFAPQAAAQ